MSYKKETIEMLITDRSSRSTPLPSGTYIRLDALGMTADPVVIGDQIKDSAGRYYEVKAVRYVMGPGDNFVRRDCDLMLRPLYGE